MINILHPPRTGGKSVRKQLRNREDVVQVDYMSYDTFERPENVERDDQFVLLVRDPYTRAIALFDKYIRMQKAGEIPLDKTTPNINEYIKVMYHRNTYGTVADPRINLLMRPCAWWGEDCTYRLIRFEKLADDFYDIFGTTLRYDIDSSDPEYTRQYALQYMDLASCRMLEDMWAHDFDLFGYARML